MLPETINVANGKNDLHVDDEVACDNIRKNWNEPMFHDGSSSLMQTYFTNNSCNPINVQGDCGIVLYVQYTTDVWNDQDAIAGIAFARMHNIRLFIRNISHDYLGKSTGFALEVSAGVQVSEVYDYLEKQEYTAIGGECPSVGIARGYISAGGHSPSSSLYGLAADGISELKGIFANGSKSTASPSKNHDIHWFLSGVRAVVAGTLAHIKSLTFRIFPDFPVPSVIFTMPYAGILTNDEFWTMVDTWHSIMPNITDAGAYAYTFY
ncbi:MAG: hypothetical protein Q9209_002422 [Squamulea sp. 1 TL-2023]